MNAVFAMAEAVGVPRAAVANLMPSYEAGMIVALSKKKEARNEP